jgi:hypothetical protein
VASENSGGGKSKIVRANTREDRVVSTTKKEPEFTGPSKYSPYVPPVVKSEPPKKSATSSKAIADAFQPAVSNGLFIGPIPLGTVRTETGYKTEPDTGGTGAGLGAGAGITNFITSNLVATPSTPTLPVTISTPPPPVKTATLDIILFDDETTPIDTMADLIFENIGGQELINITRSDIVNGQKISYQPIKNLSSIQQRYNPNNILSLQQTSDKYFAGFSIKLEDKIPNEGNGINGENIYIEESTGDLIIEFININNDEQIELQITTDGTIYEADLGEIAS